MSLKVVSRENIRTAIQWDGKNTEEFKKSICAEASLSEDGEKLAIYNYGENHPIGIMSPGDYVISWGIFIGEVVNSEELCRKYKTIEGMDK